MNNSVATEARASSLGMCKGYALVGRVSYKARDINGNVVYEDSVHNNIVTQIRIPIIKLLAGKGYWTETGSDTTSTAVLPVVTTLKLGSGTGVASSAYTDLESVISGSSVNLAQNPVINTDGMSVTFSFIYQPNSDVDGTDIHEMGLYTADGTMIARTNVGTWTKTAGLFFEVYWTIGYTTTSVSA